MTADKPGLFIALLDVESLERRFPSFPDGSDGIFEPAHQIHELFQPLPEIARPTLDPQFSDGSDGFLLLTRTRGKIIQKTNGVVPNNYHLFPQPGGGKKASEPSELPKTVFCSILRAGK